MKIDQDTFYMGIAEYVAKQSRANRSKVGAVIVKNNSIISFGYNGTLPNADNICEDVNGNTKPDVCHAELNALCKCLKEGISVSGATIYQTLSPCQYCALFMIQSGISTVYYKEEYRIKDGINILRENGIKVIRKI